MNPHTGQTTPMDPQMLRDGLFGERERAAAEVGLDDPDDLVLIEGKPEHVERIAAQVAAAKAKADRRAANKRARQSRKRNR